MFKKHTDKTWTMTTDNLSMVGFNQQDECVLLDNGVIEVDELDGSRYDSDGTEKCLMVSRQGDQLVFETQPEDYKFWEGTENAFKQGCLGFVAQLLNESNECKNTEYNVLNGMNITCQTGDTFKVCEAFLWHKEYILSNYGQLKV